MDIRVSKLWFFATKDNVFNAHVVSDTLQGALAIYTARCPKAEIVKVICESDIVFVEESHD